MNEITEQIASSIDIAEIISERVKLRASSRGYVGLCPFHSEDTPSFHVYTDTQSYYCFGCHKGGNIFSYVMETEHVDFREALQILADRSGIKLSKSGREHENKDILRLTEEFFRTNLNSSSANAPRDYIMKRGLTEVDINTFGLGYAPDAWDALTIYLRKKGFSDKKIADAGLAIQTERGIYDRFRGRIMFPIHGITGQTIGFGGRIIAGEGAKYINSPESEVYRKRKNLYLLDMARKAIREKGRSILCEGYMDGIRLHKAGFKESVASLGTSLTVEQAQLLSRYADRCYICYDSDRAGQDAAIRGMYILQANGLDVRVIMLPEGKDPDEYLMTHTHEDFENLISSAKPLILAHIEALRTRLEDVSTRKSAVRELFSSLEGLRAGEVFEYKAQLCEAAHVLPGELESMIITKKSELPEVSEKRAKKDDDDSLECALCSMLMRSADYRLRISPEEAMNILNESDTKALAYELLTEDVSELGELWLKTGDTYKLGIIERGKVLYEQMKGLNDEDRFAKVYSGLKRISIERRIAEIRAKPLEERDYQRLIELYHERDKYGL